MSNRFSGLREITKPHGGVSLDDAPARLASPEKSPESLQTVLTTAKTTGRVEPVASAAPVASGDLPPMVFVLRTKIHRDPNQSRRYFDPTELQNMAESIKRVGVIDPCSVRLRPGMVDEYDLLAGEKRHRASELANLDLIPVRIFSVDDETAADIKEISNLQRSDLNAWEESWSHMRMLMRHLRRSQEEVEKLLHRMSNQLRGKSQKTIPPEQWEIVEEVFAITGRLTWDSFRKSRLKLLKLPQEMEEILREGKLHYTKVDAILRVKDARVQHQLLKEAIAQNLSVDDIQRRVKQYKASQMVLEEKELSPRQKNRQLFRNVEAQLQEQDLWEDPQVQSLLQQLNRLISQKQASL